MLAGQPEIAEVTVFKYDFPVPIAPDDSPERGEKERTREKERDRENVEGKETGAKAKSPEPEPSVRHLGHTKERRCKLSQICAGGGGRRK